MPCAGHRQQPLVVVTVCRAEMIKTFLFLRAQTRLTDFYKPVIVCWHLLLIDKEVAMSHPSTHAPRFPSFRRFSLRKHAGLWKPAAITGASGSALAIWLDEIMMFGEEILALVFLPIMAGIIYLFDILIF